jgi:hypothetical protein
MTDAAVFAVLVTGQERTFQQDPLFAFRLLVGIGLLADRLGRMCICDLLPALVPVDPHCGPCDGLFHIGRSVRQAELRAAGTPSESIDLLTVWLI